eukprot:tig00020693_g13050.t1
MPASGAEAAAPAARLGDLPDELLQRVATHLGPLGALPLLSVSRRLRCALAGAPWAELALDLRAAAAGEDGTTAARRVAGQLRPRAVSALVLSGGGAAAVDALLSFLAGSSPSSSPPMSSPPPDGIAAARAAADGLRRFPRLATLKWRGPPLAISGLPSLRHLSILGTDMAEADVRALCAAFPHLESLEGWFGDRAALAALAPLAALRRLSADLLEPDGLESALAALPPGLSALELASIGYESVSATALRTLPRFADLRSLAIEVDRGSVPALGTLASVPLLSELRLSVRLGHTDAETLELVSALSRAVGSMQALQDLDLDLDDCTEEGCDGPARAAALLAGCRPRFRRLGGYFQSPSRLDPLASAFASGPFPRLKEVEITYAAARSAPGAESLYPLLRALSAIHAAMASLELGPRPRLRLRLGAPSELRGGPLFPQWEAFWREAARSPFGVALLHPAAL